MNHQTLIQSLRSTVRKHDATYQQVREREPVLTPYATGVALFDALSAEAVFDTEARQALLRVVVLEYQVARHPLWHALAACALQPMLEALRSRVRRLDEEDRDQALHAAFIEGIGRLRLRRSHGSGFPLLTLRRGIERVLIGAQRAKRELGDGEVPFDEGAEGCLPPPHHDPQPFVHCLAREVSELAAQRPGGEDAVRVLAGAETLVEQAERLSAADGAYERLKKRHHKAVQGVRRDVSRRCS